LRGWAWTDRDRRFEFDTIHPAPYSERNAANAGGFSKIRTVVTNNGYGSCGILYRLAGEFIF
jgi:protocatechuate 3,4-dioxygenase beta subunit